MVKNKKQLPVKLGRTITADEWVSFMNTPNDKRQFIAEDYMFPSDEIKEEYISSISSRSDAEIKNVIRQFISFGGNLGSDAKVLRSITDSGDISEYIEKYEFVRRLLSPKRHAWEGLSWVLDLLPRHPVEAIEAIRAYLLSHMAFMLEGRMTGLEDAISIIRTRFLERIDDHDLNLSVSPREFEYLVAELYRKLGYVVSITKETRDGGFDILAEKLTKGLTERVLIECKHGRSMIGVSVARSLVGAVEEHRATRCILVSTSRFTKPVLAYARETARIELVDHDELYRLLNRAFGTEWAAQIETIIRSAKFVARAV